jgi:hypothetical protein
METKDDKESRIITVDGTLSHARRTVSPATPDWTSMPVLSK